MTRITGAILAALLAVTSAVADQGARPPALTITFDGSEYLHRWSKDGQNEFTPKGDEDLSQWKRMVTLNVHETVRDGDQLAALANRVLGNYRGAGKVLRTDSLMRTPDRGAEHFVAAVLGTGNFLEAVFARFLLHDGRGLVVVYSERIYGASVGDEMSRWLGENGPGVERALRSWSRIPSRESLRALPQAGG